MRAPAREPDLTLPETDREWSVSFWIGENVVKVYDDAYEHKTIYLDHVHEEERLFFGKRCDSVMDILNHVAYGKGARSSIHYSKVIEFLDELNSDIESTLVGDSNDE